MITAGCRWCHAEDTGRPEAALRAGLAARGVRGRIYVDNGSAFASKPLLREGASLGIRLAHSTPRRPEGRGRIERFFRTVRDQFLVELDTHHPPADVAELKPIVRGVGRRRPSPPRPFRDRTDAVRPGRRDRGAAAHPGRDP